MRFHLSDDVLRVQLERDAPAVGLENDDLERVVVTAVLGRRVGDAADVREVQRVARAHAALRERLAAAAQRGAVQRELLARDGHSAHVGEREVLLELAERVVRVQSSVMCVPSGSTTKTRSASSSVSGVWSTNATLLLSRSVASAATPHWRASTRRAR